MKESKHVESFWKFDTYNLLTVTRQNIYGSVGRAYLDKLLMNLDVRLGY